MKKADLVTPEKKAPPAPRRNPLLFSEASPLVDMTAPEFGGAVFRPAGSVAPRRVFRLLFSEQTAGELLAEFSADMEINALTRGQFLLVDVIKYLLRITGPADLNLVTWNGSQEDVDALASLQNSGATTRTRYLNDLTFLRRRTHIAAAVQNQLGRNALRISKTHAKFILITNAAWRIVVRTSQNLNWNPRWESFTIGHDPELSETLRRLFDIVWNPAAVAHLARAAQLHVAPPEPIRPAVPKRLAARPNPILSEAAPIPEEASPLEILPARLAFRKRYAAETLRPFAPGLEAVAFTRGLFSLVDILDAVLEFTGPADLDLCTWTAENDDVQALAAWHSAGRLRRLRFINDISFLLRRPNVAGIIKTTFGPEALRVSRTHAKFALFSNDRWRLILRSSQNLNYNPRWEIFDLADDPDLFRFHADTFGRVFALAPSEYSESRTIKTYWELLEKAQD